MPRDALGDFIRSIAEEHRVPSGKYEADTRQGLTLINAVCERFDVSRDAARVRLQQRGILASGRGSGGLFEEA